MKKHKPICPSGDWGIAELEATWEVVQEINESKYKIDHFPARFELISFEGMLSAYSTVALPGLYDHWSFGKSYVEESNKYRETQNLAFEVVINSNPSICYLMDSNSFATQALVIAHASIGHSGFFKNNHMFKTHTRADTILPFIKRSSDRIREIEEEIGEFRVECIIDACNTIKYNSYDKYHTKKLTDKEIKAKEKEAHEAMERQSDKVLDFTVKENPMYVTDFEDDGIGWYKADSNILKFIKENSINAEPAERELMGIMLEINQYLFPQVHTQLMNEGFASFTHYHIMKAMYSMGYITEGQYWEFVRLHCSVLNQRGITEGGSTINPYKLGFDMYSDIKRMCLEPTEEDKKWFPELAGNPDWVSEIKRAAYGYKDESFISQYLSPKVIRDYKFLSVKYDFDKQNINVEDTHDDIGYNRIITSLSNQYDFFNKVPELVAITCNGEKEILNIHAYETETKNLDGGSMDDVKKHIALLWAGPVEMEVRDSDDERLA